MSKRKFKKYDGMIFQKYLIILLFISNNSKRKRKGNITLKIND